MTKPRVCYFRGSYLNPFETQYLEPLQEEYELSVAYTRSHRFEIDSIPMRKISVNCLDYFNGLLPRQIKGHHIPNLFKVFGYDEVLLNALDFAKNFDVIHAQEQAFYSSWQLAKAKQKHGFKLITVQCEVNPYWYLSKRAIPLRAKFTREQSDLFIARSERAKAALICEGVNENRIRVIGHGVDTKRFHPGPKDNKLCAELNIDSDRFIILFVGHLLWTKGIFALANAAKLVMADPEIKKLDPLFLIVGEGGERAALEQTIKNLEIEHNFKLIGRQRYNLLPAIHRLADIFVLPSISTRYILEQFGIVLIESMSTGKPVISTHCGAIDEVVGDAGILVQPNDYLRLAESLITLCKNEELRNELGIRGIDRVNTFFTNTIMSSKIASAYQEVLKL